jgi:iron(III) transport system substrate-binding protein
MLAAVALAALLLLFRFGLTPRPQPTVTAYVSQDQVYAEPILAAFTQETGIRVRSVFDSEAVKTVAIANRLLAERAHPQCDVYWGNEELRTRQLAGAGIFRETNAWVAVGYRSRRLVINTNKLSFADAPRSLVELTNARWQGRLALAYPLFGTTAAHFLALRQHWGEARWLNWCRALRANRPFLVDGNSVVVQFVVRGEALIGLTDSDDIAAAHREGAPVMALPLQEESLLIPNTLGVIRGCPHPSAAQRLFEYLQRRPVLQGLLDAHALEGATREEVTAATLQPQWDPLLRELEPSTETLKQLFLR